MGQRIAKVLEGDDGSTILRIEDESLYEVTDEGVEITIDVTFGHFLESLVQEVIQKADPRQKAGDDDLGDFEGGL